MALWIYFALAAAFAGGCLVAYLLLSRISRSATPDDAVTPLVEPLLQSNKLPLWRQMLDGLPDAALVLDGNDKVEAANAAARALLGVSSGQSISLIYRSPELLGIMSKVRKSGSVHSCETRMFSPVERQILATAAPLQSNNSGTSLAILVILRDATVQHQLSQMRADFVANASHELRTPLASLKGFIETLQGAAKNDAAARDKFLPIMQDQANRMSRLIDDLLSLSQIEMRVHVPPHGEADLAEIAREAAQYLTVVAQSANITLAVAPPVGQTKIAGERDELLQVAQNLIHNAIKYGKPGGRVDVAVKGLSERVALTVTDDGIGIAPAHLPRLTERFYRVNAKESRERGGTGLGLAIVKHIVNRHHGELKVTSKLGAGSSFTATFPQGK